jgi:hypothetical protein
MPGVEISRQSTITLLFDFRDFSMVAQFKVLLVLSSSVWEEAEGIKSNSYGVIVYLKNKVKRNEPISLFTTRHRSNRWFLEFSS